MLAATYTAQLVALVVGLAGCGSNAHHPGPAPTPHRDAPAGPVSIPRPATRLGADDADDDEPHAARSQVAHARSVGTHFFRTYLAFLYGRLPAQRVIGVDRTLRRELENGHANTTPAARTARPRVSHLSLSSAGPPVSVVAVAAVTTACCAPPSHLTATLEPHGGTWLVVAVTG
jgi:hypothetical protein